MLFKGYETSWKLHGSSMLPAVHGAEGSHHQVHIQNLLYSQTYVWLSRLPQAPAVLPRCWAPFWSQLRWGHPGRNLPSTVELPSFYHIFGLPGTGFTEACFGERLPVEKVTVLCTVLIKAFLSRNATSSWNHFISCPIEKAKGSSFHHLMVPILICPNFNTFRTRKMLLRVDKPDSSNPSLNRCFVIQEVLFNLCPLSGAELSPMLHLL